MAFTKVVLKKVTLPLFKYQHDVEYFYKFMTPITRAKEMKEEVKAKRAAAGVQSQEPPMVAQVLNLETGELGQFICPTVLTSEIIENYPGEKYVGKCFSIIIKRAGEGKRYNLIQLDEIADPKQEPAKTNAPPAAPAARR